MHIDRIEVKGFGKLTSRTICLKKGMNIIYGSNEAGKTSLQWFIKGMLYGLRGAGQPRTGWMQPRKRFMPWDGGQYGGAMTYTLDDGSIYRVERDFDKDMVKLFDSYFNDITDLFARGRDKLPAFADKQLGMDEAVFDRTVLIRQLEVRLDDDSTAALAGKLANAGSTGFDDVSFNRAEKALAEALKKNVGTDRTTMQPLDRLEARLGQLNADHDRLMKQHEQRSAAQMGLAEARGRRGRLEAESAYLERVGGLVEIRKALDTCLKQEAGLREAVRKLNGIEKESAGAGLGTAGVSTGSWGREANFAGLGEPSRQVEADVRREAFRCGEADVHSETGKLRELNRQTESDGRMMACRQTNRPEQKLHPATYILLTAATIFTLLLIYFAIADKMQSSWLFALICGFGVLSTGIAGILTFRRNMANNAAQGDARATGQEGSVGLHGQKEALAHTAAAIEIAEKMSQTKSICSYASMLCGRLISDPASVRQALKDVDARLDELSGRLDTGIVEAVRLNGGKGGLIDSDELDTVLYDSTAEHLENVWKTEKERVNKELLEASLKEKYCEGLLVESKGDNDDLQRVEEETVAVMEKIAYLRHKGDALKLAREVLTEAGLEIRRTLAPGLDSSMSSIITGLTAGKYTDLRGDDKLALKVAVPESGDIRSTFLLSGAAADQMYLALRLAMAGILTTGGENLPLLMDEVFSQYDDDRTALALNYLKNAYEKKQVLIFTCKRREVELAKEICGNDLNLVEL